MCCPSGSACRVVPISAKKGENMHNLLDGLAHHMRAPDKQPPYLHGVGAAIRRAAEQLRPLPLRQCSPAVLCSKAAGRGFRDVGADGPLQMPEHMREEINSIAAGMQSHANLTDKEMVLADALYDYIEESRACRLPSAEGT